MKIAIMTDDFDPRPERTLYYRRLIEYLLEQPSIELSLVHSRSVPDEPLYKKAREVIMPRIQLPFASRFVAFLRYCLTTKDSYDIVHWIKPRIFPFFWWFPARKQIVMAHGGGDVLVAGVWTMARRIFNWTIILFQKYIDAFIAVSEYANKEIIYAYHVPPEKVFTIYHYVDELYTSLPDDASVAGTLSSYGITPKSYFLCISRFSPHKNIRHLVLAYIRFREQNPDAREILVFGGGRRQDYAHTFGEMPDSPYAKDIRFLGYVPAEHLPSLYRGSVALSFVTLNEGFGFPIIEAFACGTPVITSSVTAMPEVAGNAAILVDPTDVDALAQALALVKNPDVRATMIARGSQRCRIFTRERSFQAILDLYRSVLSDKKSLVFPPEAGTIAP